MNRIFWVSIIILVIGCGGNRDELAEQLIQERVQAKLDVFIAAEKQRCWDKMWEDASRTADSLLRLNPIRVRLDSLTRPPKPLKPSRPHFEPQVDTIGIKVPGVDTIDSMEVGI